MRDLKKKIYFHVPSNAPSSHLSILVSAFWNRRQINQELAIYAAPLECPERFVGFLSFFFRHILHIQVQVTQKFVNRSLVYTMPSG